MNNKTKKKNNALSTPVRRGCNARVKENKFRNNDRARAALPGLIILFFTLIPLACYGNPVQRDFRADMRRFVQTLSTYGKGIQPGFIVVPQNGHELLTEDGVASGKIASDYLQAIDGIGQESLFYGHEEDNEPTPDAERRYLSAFTDIARENGLVVLVTDYCWSRERLKDSYTLNAQKGYLSFGAENRDLNRFHSYPPEPFNVNTSHIDSLTKAKNFLYLINPENFPDKGSFLSALQETNYDLLIIDLFFRRKALGFQDIALLKQKANGGNRLVLAYMSIGEAEDYRYYWKACWNETAPSWLADENPCWPGNFKIHYWDPEWQSIIFGNDHSYLKKILDAGFDGVYLDIIDAFQYFESKTRKAKTCESGD